MTVVFFLFLFHSSLGLLSTLPLVPQAAGARFFKFCSGASAFMSTAGVWLLFRRLERLDASAETPGPESHPMMLALAVAFVLLTVLYNRAEHFGWQRLRLPLLVGALLCGVGAIGFGAGPDHRALVVATDLSSAVLLGSSAGAMILGHWYLTVLDLPISALRRVTVMLAVGLALRTATVALALFGTLSGALEGAQAIAAGLWSPDGIFVWMRLLFGILGPITLMGFIWKTVEIRSTQSATGILYVQLLLVMTGELLAKYLRVAVGFPL
jgi:hypothetical protein